jgi:hypothetical protein
MSNSWGGAPWPRPVTEPPQDTAERRQLTVMFCDLVGSTALSARLDPEDPRGMIGAYHRCATELVERNDGFVAKYMGDGVLAYFGYPQAELLTPHLRSRRSATKPNVSWPPSVIYWSKSPRYVSPLSKPLHPLRPSARPQLGAHCSGTDPARLKTTARRRRISTRFKPPSTNQDTSRRIDR